MPIAPTSYRVHSGPSSAGAERAINALLESLQQLHPGLPREFEDGLRSYETPAGVVVRSVASKSEQLLACELIDLAGADAWEAFVVSLDDGSVRTGWRRRGAHAIEPPLPWAAAASTLDIGPELTPQHEPSFLSLAGAYASSAPPVVASCDLNAREGLASELEHWRAMCAQQASTLRALRQALQSKDRADEASPDAAASHPMSRSLDDLPAWAEANADRIVIMPRALSGAKKSVYESPAKIFEALEFLAETFPAVKSGQLPRERLRERAKELGLFIGGSVDPSRAGMSGDEYFVDFGGRRRFLDQHLGRGGSRDLRYCLRVYYFWDDASARVVVGWLPTHLSNSLT